MRSSLAFVLVIGLAACGSSSNPGDPTDDPDAGTLDDAGSLPPPARGFQIKSPTVDIAPGTEVTYCYYFKTSNATELAIKKWASHMTSGSHHMILYLTTNELKPAGTMTAEQCGFGSGKTPVWTYSAQTADAEAALPSDDGHGNPVGQVIKAGHFGFLQMHYLNSSDDVIHAHAELNAYAYDEGVQVTQAAPFVTYNTAINLAPGSKVTPKPGMVNGSCTVSPDAKFYVVSTHTHKQGVGTFIQDGAINPAGPKVFESTSWEHPGEKAWSTAPFYSFASGKLSYQCDYMNPNNYSIQDGDSADTEEMCMAIGYYFPATSSAGHLCLDSYMLY
jgi:hypothetical protein